jgi:hypothetical protein
MTAAEMLELLMRGAAVGAFVGLASMMAHGLTPAKLTGALFCLAAAAHTLTQLPQSASALGWAWPPIWALSVMGAGLFWAFVLELFEDRSTLMFGEFARHYCYYCSASPAPWRRRPLPASSGFCTMSLAPGLSSAPCSSSGTDGGAT